MMLNPDENADRENTNAMRLEQEKKEKESGKLEA
jgi:hypothetical protein